MRGALPIFAAHCPHWLKFAGDPYRSLCYPLPILIAYRMLAMTGCLVRAPLPEMLGPWLTWPEITTLQRTARTLHFSLLPDGTDLEGLVWIARAMSSRSLAHKGLLELWMDQTDIISPALNAQSNVMLEHICFVLQPLRDCLSARSCPRAIRTALQDAIPPARYQRMVFYAVNWTLKSMAAASALKRYRSSCRSPSNSSSCGSPYLSSPLLCGEFW